MSELWTDSEVATQVELLLAAKGWSLRRLGRETELDVTYLSRALRRDRGQVLSIEAALRVSVALGFPADALPEYREARVIEAVRSDPALRDLVYRRLT